MENSTRKAIINRKTGETEVSISLVLDGTGVAQINTGVGMLDHLLAQLAKHGRFDLAITGKGDLEVNEHHTVEDVGIALGQAFAKALGDRSGIIRMGHAIVPLDESLALVAVDLSGRGYGKIDIAFDKDYIGELPTDLVGHFLESFAMEGRLTFHGQLLAGSNDHHKAEALFKSLARAMDMATTVDDRITRVIPSTKGVLDH